MLVERVAEAVRRAGERPLERLVGERLDLSAVVAHEVVMVVRAADGLDAGDAVADVDPLHEPQLDERVERAVDARDTDGSSVRADPVVDLLSREAATLRCEMIDDGTAGAAPAKPGALQAGERDIRPAHRADDIDSQLC